MNSYSAYALLVAVCGGLSFIGGAAVFRRLRGTSRVVPGNSASIVVCPPGVGLPATDSRLTGPRLAPLKKALSALGSTSGAGAPEAAADSLEPVTAFQRLMLEDAPAALRLRNQLSSVTANEMASIRDCMGRDALPVSTYFEVAWTVRRSGDCFLATDGRFEGVRRGAMLSVRALNCLGAATFLDHAFAAPDLRLDPDFHSRVTVTFLLARPD